MGSSYLKNFIGFSLTDEEFNDVPYPMTELTTHVTLKTVQAGAFLGCYILGPLSAVARSSTRSLTGLYQTAGKYGRRGVVIGLVIGPPMTYMRMRTINASEDSIRDRSYRIRQNRNQVRVDQGSVAGGFLGTGLNLATGRCPMTGGVFGIGAGVIGMAVYNNVVLKQR